MYKLTKKEESLISEFQHHILNFYLFLERIQSFVTPIYEKYYLPGSEYSIERAIGGMPYQNRAPLIDIRDFLGKYFIDFFQNDVINETNSFLKNIEIINQEAQNNFLISDRISTVIEEHYNYFVDKFKRTEIKTLDMLYKVDQYLNKEKFNEIKQDFRDKIALEM
jgi:hypothetical protein|nr:MAG TPA: hypothetical protein [Bacteriophage sp.]